jgi:hypothetical protein
MRRSMALALSTALLVAALAMPAAGQGVPPACTQPLDPACNHLKCYQIKDKPSTVVSRSPLLQVDNQFGREVIYRLQPVLLCVPSQKACCCPGSPGCPAGATGCSAANCAPDPVPAPGLPHFKCYKIKAKTCTNPACATLAAAAKGIQVNLRDQFGQELNVPVGSPKLICAPAEKIVVGQSTTTTSTTTSTTTTTIICHFDSSPTVNGCVGPCPPNAPPGSQCLQTGPGKCDCIPPPVCCQCTTSSGSQCFDSSNPCPANCVTVPNADCDPATHACTCGFCIDNGACSNVPCSANQPCPAGTTCDPHDCPRPCGDSCAGQSVPCTSQCQRPDGTISQCRQQAGQTTCSCCGPAGSFCTSDSDCCSLVCNVSAGSCQ